MPEFVAEHTPPGLDEFTAGYLEAAEWLLDEGVNRRKLRGFTRAAIKAAKADCHDFQRANEANLEAYCAVTGRGMRSAGVDFWLTRNRHGAGFWDRGTDPALRVLTDAAHLFGSCDTEVYRGWINLV